MKDYIYAFPISDYLPVNEIVERGKTLGDVQIPEGNSVYARALHYVEAGKAERTKNDAGHWAYRRKTPEIEKTIQAVVYYFADHAGEIVLSKDVKDYLEKFFGEEVRSNCSSAITGLYKSGYINSAERGAWLVFDNILEHPYIKAIDPDDDDSQQQLEIVDKPKRQYNNKKSNGKSHPEMKALPDMSQELRTIELFPSKKESGVTDIVSSLLELEQKAKMADHYKRALEKISEILMAVHIID